MITEYQLSELCVIQSGGTPSRGQKKYWGGDIAWAKISDIDNAGGHISITEETITEDGLSAIRNRIFDTGTLLFAMYGSVGKTATTLRPMTTNQAILGIKIKKANMLSMSYLTHWLMSKQSQFEKDARGVAQKNLSAGYIRELRIPLPPLKEQKRIAAILDKADAIRRKRQQAIELADQFLRSVFLDMFGDPVTNPKNHDRVTIESVCLKVTDGTHHSPKPKPGGVPYITARHVKPNRLDFYRQPTYVSQEAHKEIYSRCNPLKGDVLYIKDGATTGAAAINHYDFEFSMLSSLALLKPDSKFITSEYLCDWLNLESNKERILRNVSGAAITRLTIRKIKDLGIELPDLSQQARYVAVRRRILSYVEKQSSLSLKDNELFNTLTQQAFKGELTSAKAA